MRGYAELILGGQGGTLDEEGKVYLEKVTGSARRLDSLIADVITYTGILRTELKLSPVQPEPLVRELIESFPELAAHAAVFEIVGPMPAVLAHEASLAQCLAHLLANAVKFIAPGVEPHVRITAEEHAGVVRIWVADNGIGIEPRDQQRIFNLFERIGPADTHPGLGIGLAIVRKTIERAKGRVGVESAPGRGSRFWIQLPTATHHP
jgi:signal transduction histidine kinase